jgi:hypothetical protein
VVFYMHYQEGRRESGILHALVRRIKVKSTRDMGYSARWIKYIQLSFSKGS